MTEFTPQLAGRVRDLAVFDEWQAIIAAGWATAPLLMSWRIRLAGGEFEPGPLRESMGLAVDDALAAMLDCGVFELPGREPVPDSPAGLDVAGEAPDEDRRHRWG